MPVKATGNRDNLMGLYLSGEKEEEADDGETTARERPTAVKEKFRGPPPIYRARLSPREKEIGIETKITDPTSPPPLSSGPLVLPRSPSLSLSRSPTRETARPRSPRSDVRKSRASRKKCAVGPYSACSARV